MNRQTIIRVLTTILFCSLLSIAIVPGYGWGVAIAVDATLVACSFLPMPQQVLGLNTTNNYTGRQAYDHARKMFWKAMRNEAAFNKGTPAQGDELCWQWVNALKLSQSEVRLECEFNAANTNFKFGLTQNQANSTGVQFNTENRLTMQDSLCCNEYAIYVGQPSSRTDTTWQRRTYGNTQDFAAAFADEIDTTFFNHSFFKLTCNNDVIVPYRGLWNHHYKPQTQQTAALGAGSPGDQVRGAEDGFVTAEPNFVLMGNRGYIPEIILPVAMANAAAFSRIIIEFRGVLAQNSTTVS